MQSSGTWTSVPSSSHQQSDDSSSGVDGFTLISANTESSQNSYLDLNANHNMALPLGNSQPTSETHHPQGPAVVDWVEEQSLPESQTPNDAMGVQRAGVDSVSLHSGPPKQACASTNQLASHQEGRQQAKVYDIPTLLKLRDTQSAVPVMLRIKPEAIAGKSIPLQSLFHIRLNELISCPENIFQYMGAGTSRRLAARSRGLSEMSNFSTGNAEPHNQNTYPVTRPRYVAQPIRQPHAPPNSSALQRHDGFVRFLKQHASPPHQRVTAGGRIVPAGPSSPPPMLDFSSLNGFLRERPVAAKPSQKESRSSQSNTRVQKPQVTSSMSLGDYLRSQNNSGDSTSLQNVAQYAPMQAAVPFSNMPLGCQTFMAPAMQTQTPIVPLAMFPDGSALVSCNGLSYRASWNGTNTCMEPLQTLQPSVDQQYCTQAYPQVYSSNSQYGVVPQVSVPSVPLASATNVTRPDISKAELFLQNEAQGSDELSLKAKLTNLDEHLALHHYDITPVDRASLIAQRIYLVAELDRIRLSKTKPNHKIPIVAPAVPGVPVTPAAQPSSGAQNNPISKGGTMSKHLSPAAPPFVPRSALEPSSTSFGMRTTSQQSKHQRTGLPASAKEIATACTAKVNAKPSAWTSHSDNKAQPQITERKSPNEASSSSSSVLDPSDPAMRVIEYKDIEYAARYLYNWTKDTKTYCTTVSEFQEAIRRVREQARLYGCAGGQSKDPAYDAEQDLWWAICDRDPIPLPSKIPDHVAHPRPWNWNDSAFNYRLQGNNDAPVPECEQARNSPRLLGWNPATTDKMKDAMDVTRSYFALKGRLPSVSFRDFAYDRDGNKRLIQSDTAVSIAYTTAAEDKTCLGKSPMTSSQWNGIGSIADSKAPAGVKTNELNIQRTGTDTELNAQLKPGDKAIAHEAVCSTPGVPCTPEDRHTQQPFEAGIAHNGPHLSKPKASAGHRDTGHKGIEINNGPYCAFVEAHPETPVARGIRSASKGVLNARITSTPPNVGTDPLSTGSKVGPKRSPLQANVLGRAGVSGPRLNPTEEELNGIWYQTPLDEATQKYLDDMKAFNSMKSKQADDKNYHVDAAKLRHQITSSSEPVAESKSTWGPEDDTSLTDNGRNHLEAPETNMRAEDRGMARTARVKIPNASPLRAPISRVNGQDHSLANFNAQNSLDSPELNSINIPR